MSHDAVQIDFRVEADTLGLNETQYPTTKTGLEHENKQSNVKYIY
jgi:hypothetical protein